MNIIISRSAGLSIGILASLLFVIATTYSQDTLAEPVISSAEVFWVADDLVIEDAESLLTRMEYGIFTTFHTVDLTPDDAYTGWWIIFNSPQNCSDNHCGFNDVILVDENGNSILDENGNERPNRSGRAATQASLLRATHGLVDEDGSLDMKAHLPIFDTTEAVWGPGLMHSMKAEVHYVLRSHGPATPGIIADQFLTPWGGCPESPPRDPCEDLVQGAIHLAVES